MTCTAVREFSYIALAGVYWSHDHLAALEAGLSHTHFGSPDPVFSL